MDNKKVQLFTSMSGYEKVNERFAKVKVRIAYEGENRNGSYISKEAFEKATSTLKFCPVVGYYLEDKEMFDGHTEKLEIIGDEWNFKTMTQPYGVVTDEAPFWEDVKAMNGEVKSYYTCYAYLWVGRYPELESIKDRDFKQSMEILCDKGGYNNQDDLYHIDDFTFDALCILEAKEPCFEDSTISLNYSKDNYEKEYKSMISELKEFTFNLLSEKGGQEVEDEKKFEDEVCEECGKTPCECETEDMAKKKKCEDESEEKNEEFAKKENFELSFDEIREKLRKEIQDDDTYAWVVQVFTDHLVYAEDSYDDGCYQTKMYRQGYSLQNDEVVLAEERVEVFSRFLTKEEMDKVESDRLGFEKQINDLKAQYTDLTSDKVALEGEIVELREYKANVEKAEFEAQEVARKSAIDEKLSVYSKLENCEGYKEIMAKKYEVGTEMIEIQLKAIAYDNNIKLEKQGKKNFSKEVNKIPVLGNSPEDNSLTEAERRYGKGISKYLNK